MKDIPHRVSFQSGIPIEQHHERVSAARTENAAHVKDDPSILPETRAFYEHTAIESRVHVFNHLRALGAPEELIKKRLSNLRLVIGGTMTHYNPLHHALVIQPTYIEQSAALRTDAYRAVIVRHEVAHALAQTTLFFSRDGSRVVRNGLAIRKNYDEYGYTLNELVIDSIAARSEEDGVASTPRAQIFTELITTMSARIQSQHTPDEIYGLFARVACEGWSVRPAGKQLKQIIRAVYGPDGMSILMRLRFPNAPDENQTIAILRNNPRMQFLLNPPDAMSERMTQARGLLKKK